ncbi:MAG: 3-deoxy-manno-octulosonate cytidylyltransferase [Hydrogenothermus sp.]|nr:MAG: 3-deoxy-manno-octulosonate cytidylyltransferase [Hydrogenothermus sp.]
MATVIIPARRGSTRLKDKLLLKVKDKPIIYWTVSNCLKAKNIDKVIVATDSIEIQNALYDLPVEVVITPMCISCGSDRIAYVAQNISDEIIINVQGDEPTVSANDIDNIAKTLENEDCVSLYYPIENEEDFKNPNVVKVVMDKNNYALYFSRSHIPYPRDISFEGLKKLSMANKHIGVYGYKRNVLLDFAYNLESPQIEQIEKLEQLRLLYSGYKIKMIRATKDTIGIDTYEDYERFKNYLENSTQ